MAIITKYTAVKSNDSCALNLYVAEVGLLTVEVTLLDLLQRTKSAKFLAWSSYKMMRYFSQQCALNLVNSPRLPSRLASACMTRRLNALSVAGFLLCNPLSPKVINYLYAGWGRRCQADTPRSQRSRQLYMRENSLILRVCSDSSEIWEPAINSNQKTLNKAIEF